ncbi:transcription factor bHLH68-like isoform X4 [Cucumis melo]|uniref:Transcription factor bHLH68-like isoform X4 n=1 Tax=Cucumis melo TaxID=3656 RepID=A0ABM3KR99_CUCME|nr:transcription factor bHLH68-like isoform X4 [Cucumis melo]
MMGGNPSNWWNMFPSNSPQCVLGSSSSLPLSSMADHHHNQDPNSQSWSQLLLGGLQEEDVVDEDKLGLNNNFQQQKKMENLEGRIFIPFSRFGVGDHHHHHQDHNNNDLDHHHDQMKQEITCSQNIDSKNQILDHNFSSDQCASPTTNGGVWKKARVQPSSGQPPVKVRKEKVGDRITALHQLVSPFGKTDTASVLSEAIGYVRFLQSQIEALISPYLVNSSKSTKKKEQLRTLNDGRNYLREVEDDNNGRSCVFAEDLGQQLLNDNSLKRKLPPSQEEDEEEEKAAKDLRGRGLCLVPVSCTQHVQSDINGADYWAQAYNHTF